MASVAAVVRASPLYCSVRRLLAASIACHPVHATPPCAITVESWVSLFEGFSEAFTFLIAIMLTEVCRLGTSRESLRIGKLPQATIQSKLHSNTTDATHIIHRYRAAPSGLQFAYFSLRMDSSETISAAGKTGEIWQSRQERG